MTENITKTTSTPTDAVNKAYAAFEAARQAYDISIRGNDLHQAEKDLDALKKAEKQYALLFRGFPQSQPQGWRADWRS